MSFYHELILDHARHPQHVGLRAPFSAEVHHINPTCGDEVTLRVAVEDGVVTDVSYDAQGCAISIASTSVLAEETIGHPVDEALETFLAMRRMLTSKGADGGDPDKLGDGVAFAGVSRNASRVKCALLGWTAFTDALAQSGHDISAAASEHV